MNDGNAAAGGGFGFAGALALLFIALKLTHYIEWRWLWVLAPLWIPFAILAVILLGYLVVYLIVLALQPRKRSLR